MTEHTHGVGRWTFIALSAAARNPEMSSTADRVAFTGQDLPPRRLFISSCKTALHKISVSDSHLPPCELFWMFLFADLCQYYL